MKNVSVFAFCFALHTISIVAMNSSDLKKIDLTRYFDLDGIVPPYLFDQRAPEEHEVPLFSSQRGSLTTAQDPLAPLLTEEQLQIKAKELIERGIATGQLRPLDSQKKETLLQALVNHFLQLQETSGLDFLNDLDFLFHIDFKKLPLLNWYRLEQEVTDPHDQLVPNGKQSPDIK